MSATVSSIFESSPAAAAASDADVPAGATVQRLDVLSDEELLRRYIDAKDQAAFQALYARYRVRLHRFVLRLTRDSHEADEVFQETWMAVIRGKVRYHATARFAAYLFSIAHRRLVDRWRRLKRAPALQADGEDSFDPDEIADALTVTPEDWTQHAQLRNALLIELGKLPVIQREVFLMKAEADLSLEEIAAITGATHEATKSRLRYALARLRAALRTWK